MYLLFESPSGDFSTPIAISKNPHKLAEIADSLWDDGFTYRSISSWEIDTIFNEAISRTIVYENWDYFVQTIMFVSEV